MKVFKIHLVMHVAVFVVFGLFTTVSKSADVRDHYSYNHIPPVGIYEHEDICLGVFVERIREGDEARVQFRVRSGDSFHMIPLGYNPAERRFIACIDERFHRNAGIEYYIELFPADMAPIRIPETTGEFYSVRIRKSYSRIGRPLLLAFLIASPAIAVFFYSKIKSAHAKRKAEYEGRLRARRKKLHKEREKHYQEYLKTLSGRKPHPVQTSRAGNRKYQKNDKTIKTDVNEGAVSQKESEPWVSQKPKSEKSEKRSKRDTDTQLKKELDSILDSKHGREDGTGAGRKSENRKQASSGSAGRQTKKTGLLGDSGELSDEDKRKLLELFDE
jgi:hypothetical protein